MSTLEPIGRPYEAVDKVGLALTQTRIGLHCSFVYKSDLNEIRTLGLANHLTLEDDLVSDSYRWAELGLDTDNKEILRILISRIKNKKPIIPYAFDHSGVVFSDDGTLSRPPAGFGLTCATFIVAVLRTYAYEIIDTETWPDRPRDEEQFALILKFLKRQAGEEYVGALMANKEARSINPDEIVSAGSLPSDDWPISYTVSRNLADEIMRDLEEKDS